MQVQVLSFHDSLSMTVFPDHPYADPDLPALNPQDQGRKEKKNLRR